MSVLTQAHAELFRRPPDEAFPSVEALTAHCRGRQEVGRERWQLPQTLAPVAADGGLALDLGDAGRFRLTDWSFGQVCRLAGVSKETVNRLSVGTAAQALRETLPAARKPTQVLTAGAAVRAVHGTAYSRVWDADLVDAVRDAAPGFGPPQRAVAGGTGLYCGEQNLFAFLVDPEGWCEVGGEAFAPGFFVWNSEVGRRSLGVCTFWFQAVCANHIVWDAAEVVRFAGKHTGRPGEALGEVRRVLAALAARRDERRDGFVRVLKRAMETTLGADADEAFKALTRHGIPPGLGKEALKVAERTGRFTVFVLVDALTRLAQQYMYVGDRTEADQRASALLALAA